MILAIFFVFFKIIIKFKKLDSRTSHFVHFSMAYKRSLSHDKRLKVCHRQLGPQGVTDYNYRCYPIFKCPKRPQKVKNQNFRPCYDFFI